MRRIAMQLTGKMLLYAVLTAIVAVMFIPFIWMFSSSLKTLGDLFLYPPRLIPNPMHWENYRDVIESMPLFPRWIFNSFKIALFGVIGQTLSCSLAAYAFARLKFPFKDVLFLLLLATLMIPPVVTIIPTYLLFSFFGWLDTHKALMIPPFLGGAFGTFLLRQFFLTIPQDLVDAAKIDGCSDIGIYWRIFLPLSKPALAALAVFVFNYHWNDLLAPVIYLTTRELYTISVGLHLLQGYHLTFWNLIMAGAVMSVIPVVVLYVLLQRYFVAGIALTGLKG